MFGIYGCWERIPRLPNRHINVAQIAREHRQRQTNYPTLQETLAAIFLEQSRRAAKIARETA